jgi:hypothetical protein
MARNVINRSISFDPEIFNKMEDRRARLLMERSEYVVRLITKDLREGGSITVDEVPESFVKNPIQSIDRSRKPKKRGK